MAKRFAAVTAALCACLLVLAGCSSSGEKTARPGGDLAFARAADATTLLPPTTTQNEDIWTLQQVYETLTLNKPDGSGVEPGLATDWEESKDKMSWTFHLREGVKFHSGKTLDADDVVFSLNYARDQEDENNLWAAEFDPIKDVKKVDDHTVRIDLKQPWGPLPSYMALFAASIYPDDFGGHDAEYMAAHADGTGPFEVGNWNKGQSLELVKNPDYWEDGVPSLDSVTFNVVADDNTRRLQLQGGQADINQEPAPLSMSQLSRSQDINAQAFTSTKILYFNINNKEKGLDDPKLRRAMSYAVDRKSIVEVVYAGYAEPATSFISPGLAGHADKVDSSQFDMEKAKQLVKESDHPDGIDITIQIPSGVADRELLAQIAQQAWQDIGLTVHVQKLDDATLTTNRTNGDFQVQVSYATSDVSDTSQMINFLAVTDDSGIRSGYANPKVEKWAEEAVAEEDPEKQNELYAQIQQQVADEAPIVPIAYQRALYGMSRDVVGFEPYVLGTYGLKETKLKH
ncbi:ABC transporter substrate-binding protein [Brevibacterium sediminis]|uniref:Diguanylate phosphodiesterase n=1 Tax=Brevibacterium sediminis TaxID=1857024 RepID=A0ABQ1MM62_9MICO|nr:ABC transporter substrate-binding protein [Brevibacterium sediminis]GGC42887.1 diguanylate phosphodiesterase [Brevibacterium sediminis]